MKEYKAYTIARLGYLRPKEVDCLVKYVKLLPKNPVIVNIGAGFGTSALCFAEPRHDAKIFSIDLRDDDNPFGGLLNERNSFSGTGLSLPTQIKGDSKEVGKTWDKEIDLLFIDGDHSKEGVGGDIDIWIPHVKDGGYVLFHDYGSRHHGFVTAAVDELAKTLELVEVAKTVAVFLIERDGNVLPG